MIDPETLVAQWHPPAQRQPVDLAARLVRSGTVQLRTQIQATARSCWAAVASSAAEFYGDPSWSQSRVADAMRLSLRDVARVDHALDAVGRLRHTTRGPVPLDELIGEIDAGRPLCAVLEWEDGGVHFVLVHGYEVRVGRTLVLLGDPRLGGSFHLWRDFPRNYGRGGRWTWTCWLP